MADELLRVKLLLDGGADIDAQEVDRLTGQLRRQLLKLDVHSVDWVLEGEAPRATRAPDAIAVGALAVAFVAHSPEMLKLVVAAVQSWLASHQGRSVELQLAGESLKVSGISSEDQRRLIELFVAHHGR